MPAIQASPALAKLRILDLTRVRAGPTCVRQFADFGADVIKIENTAPEDISIIGNTVTGNGGDPPPGVFAQFAGDILALGGSVPVAERLKHRIIDGDRDGLEADLIDFCRRRHWTWNGFARVAGPFPKAELRARRDALRDELKRFVDAAGAERGRTVYAAECITCHGTQARGTDRGPNVMRSLLLLRDRNASELGPFVKKHTLQSGRPGTSLTDAQLLDLSHFLHQRLNEILGKGKRRIAHPNVERIDLKPGVAAELRS